MNNVIKRGGWVAMVLPMVCLAMVLLASAAHAAHAAHVPTKYDGHAHVVYQCDRADEGIRAQCERFIIPAHPMVGELGEATATHRYEEEWCDLYRDGHAGNCTVEFVAKGDQIIKAR